MRYILDTTVLIDHARGEPAALALVRDLFSKPVDLYICDVVVAEAMSGGSDEERAGVAALAQAIEYVSIPPDAAAWAGDARRRRGSTSPRSIGDALIAGVAWFMDATVVTRNPEDFEVQGVKVLGYG